jgi:acyl-CoA synthetase (AMP-forming)/AMP-acid ligase II
MLTHRNLVANVAQFEFAAGRFWRKGGGEVLISPLPFFHIYGFTASLNIALSYGCEVVTMPQFDLLKFLTLCKEKRATQAQLVPPIIIGLAKHPAVDAFLPLHLKTITSGAAPLGVEVQKAAAARLGCSVDQAWGKRLWVIKLHLLASPFLSLRVGGGGGGGRFWGKGLEGGGRGNAAFFFQLSTRISGL